MKIAKAIRSIVIPVVSSALICIGCKANPPMIQIAGIASTTNEAQIYFPDLTDQIAILNGLEEVLVSSKFESMASFLESFSGVFEDNDKLLLQIGGNRDPNRKYRAESLIKEIPGCESFDAIGDKWWPNRSETDHRKKLLLYTASISQELLTESLVDYYLDRFGTP